MANMAKLDILLRIAKAYTILLELVTKNAENAKIELSSSIKKISERDTTKVDENYSDTNRMKLEDTEKLDQVYITILQIVIESNNDIEPVEKLAELFRQTLSHLTFDQKPIPITINELFELVIRSTLISNDFKLLMENIKKTIYLS